MIKFVPIICFVLFVFNGFSQEMAYDSVITAFQNKYIGITDYKADITIITDIDFIKMKERRARLFFKAPNKLKVRGKGFFLLPKKGLHFSSGMVTSEGASIFFIKKEVVNGVECEVYKIFPGEKEKKIVLTTAWIDKTKNRLIKLENNTRNDGTFLVNLYYNNRPFDLPDKIEVLFNTEKMQIPVTFTGESSIKKDTKQKMGAKEGTIIVKYDNYQVNKGIDETIFIPENEEN